MDFAAYYKREISQLRDLGAMFAEQHPTLAGSLKERGNDPDIERLLQGISFLTALIRVRLDAGMPTLVQNLAELLAPDCLRTLPAATIVELTPNIAALRSPQVIAAGKMLSTRPVDGTVCRFRTCCDVELLPLELVSTRLDDTAASRPAIFVRLRASDAGRDSLRAPRPLRLYFHHALPAVPATLALWFVRHCEAVHLQGPDGVVRATLRPENIRLMGLDRSTNVYPIKAGTPRGLHLLLEYFSLPEKFYFLDLAPFELPEGIPAESDLVFYFRAPPPLPAPLGSDSIRLFCTPAINLFEATAEPILHTPTSGEHLLRADGVPPRHMEVFSVHDVVGVGPRGGRREVRPFHRFEHLGAARKAAFSLRRERCALDDGFDTFLSMVEPDSVRELPELESISATLVCTNRNLSRELGIGYVEDAALGPLLLRCRNISAVTPPVRQPLQATEQWRMVAHLALHQRGYTSAENLRLLLQLYNLPGLLQTQLGRGNLRRIESIRKVERRPGVSTIEGVPVRGIHTEITIDEAGFSGGAGEMFLFGAVLNEVLGTTTSINVASELSLRPVPSGQEMRWDPHLGT